MNISYHFLDQWKFGLIIQKVNKTQTVCLCDTNTSCIHNVQIHQEQWSVPPEKQKYENGSNFSLIWDSIPRSHKIERLWLLHNLGWEERWKNVAVSTLWLLKLGDQTLCPHIIQTASNCVALKATVFHTNQQKVVPVYAMQAFRGVDVQIHKHILSLSTTVNGHEWPASCQATPMPTEQEAGWEPELAWAFRRKKISSPGRNQSMMHLLSNLWHTQYINCYLSFVWYLSPLKSCRVHTAANFVTMRLKNAVK